MKQVLLVVSAIIAFTACKKDNAAQLRSQLAGKWEFSGSSGFGINRQLPPGNGYIIVFGLHGDFQRWQHDTLIFKGSYLLTERKECYGDEKEVFLATTDPHFVKDYSVNFYNGQLFISTPNCYIDGGSGIYRKLENGY